MYIHRACHDTIIEDTVDAAVSVDDVTHPAYLVVRRVQLTDDARAELVGVRKLS